MRGSGREFSVVEGDCSGKFDKQADTGYITKVKSTECAIGLHVRYGTSQRVARND